MLRFLEALNPYHFFFTVADFEDALIDIQAILETLDSTSDDENHPLSATDKKEWLEKAFHLAAVCLNAAGKKNPDKQLAFLLADILRQYAMLCYEENYFAAKQIMVMSLNLHLYTIGVFSECQDIHDFASLDDLKEQGETHPNLFSAIEQTILSTSKDHCLTLAHTNSFMLSSPKKKLFSLAETARWLGCCYQNLDQTNALNEDNELRFSQLFGLSEALHLLNNDEMSKQALADLHYQAWPFMQMRKTPLDITDICQMYAKALLYDPSKEMQARVANQQFLLLFSSEKKSEALPFIQKALLLAEASKKTEKNDFLLSEIYANYASYWMEPETLDLDQAEIYLEKAGAYVAHCRAQGKDRLQFALYDLRAAEYKFVRGEFRAANESIERTLATLQKHPHSQKPYMIKALAFKSLIAKTLKLIDQFTIKHDGSNE